MTRERDDDEDLSEVSSENAESHLLTEPMEWAGSREQLELPDRGWREEEGETGGESTKAHTMKINSPTNDCRVWFTEVFSLANDCLSA